ncbi:MULTISPECIES: hypothetical protein [Streptomyces]|uniref:hypothetical protein n=1 Tax=Streptomyces TaxID=1883 RepID=UPI0011810F6D|nr:hypothetical protein [Streptomyces tsukubensis]QFR94564.1 hypothetical protein GBW32_17830 [Streptomyces tsukubensis]
MTARTPGDRARRRNLADASITPMPAFAGLLRRIPGQRHRTNPIASLEAPAPGHEGGSRIGTER